MYLDYMDARFEKKKAQAVDHSVAAWAQAVNTGGRNKNSRMHMAAPGYPDMPPVFMEKTRNFMTTNFDCFRFCHRCIGSE